MPLVITFGVAVLCSAALPFLIQPTFLSLVIPKWGGDHLDTFVELMAVLVFGAILYAFVLCRVRSLGTQVLIHAVVLLAVTICVVAAWPLVQRGLSRPMPGDHVLFGSLLPWLIFFGLPVFAASGAIVILPSWLSRLRRAAPYDPYFLVACASLGAILGQAAHPSPGSSPVWDCNYRSSSVSAPLPSF